MKITSTAALWKGRAAALFMLAAMAAPSSAQAQQSQQPINLPTSKRLLPPAPGSPQVTNSLPITVALSGDGKYLAILNNGYGTQASQYQQSIAVLNLATGGLRDYPEMRLARRARQSFFVGLAFSGDSERLYASMGSLPDPEGLTPGDTGNGIAVYRFENGKPAAERFIKIPLPALRPDQLPTGVSKQVPKGKAVPFPAGLAVVESSTGDELLVADNLSDDAVLINAANGHIVRRFDLSVGRNVPAAYPLEVAAASNGKAGFVSLWNSSEVAELDLNTGAVRRRISLLKPSTATEAGSHPSALLLSPGGGTLYVALANADRVAAVDVATGKVRAMLSTRLPGEQYGGTYPIALAQTADGRRLFVADSASDAVVVFDLGRFVSQVKGNEMPATVKAAGFIPTEWYPTALAVQNGSLWIATGKGHGTGPNSARIPGRDSLHTFPYIATLIRGSVARVNLAGLEKHLGPWTREVEQSNLMRNTLSAVPFARGSNPIRHVIYVIKENRSYDQIFGDLKEANGDPSLVMYGEDVTPNQHALARQFGILDNFYVSGEVSGDGHVWSTAAIDSDYTEKTWEIGYRSRERLYDYEGGVANGIPLNQGIPDVDEPGTGFLWTNAARHGVTHRNYGEFITTEWCNVVAGSQSPKEGTPLAEGEACTQTYVNPGQPLPANVGQPHGSNSPYPWRIPIIARDVATKPELVGHFDPKFADFNLYYPDQLRTDEFLNEFQGFVTARKQGGAGQLPQLVILRLPNDHTLGTRPGGPTPAASIADNDLAVGRLVEAVSHSPYWDDTAIFILEDDAQDGPDHVDAHRSPALVISKYSQGSASRPYVEKGFYTTVNMIRTMEALLGLPPMNNNDAMAPVMKHLFSGPGTQPAFTARYGNRAKGLIYKINPPHAPGAQASMRMDFTHADAADAAQLNAILWRDRKGDTPMPKPRHKVIRAEGEE